MEIEQERCQEIASCPPWLEESDEDSDDDWFYRSISRYKQLCTYSLICEPTAIDIHSATRRLVIAGARSVKGVNSAHDRKKFEIAIYLIPEKLVMEENKEKEGLLSKRDLALLAGVALDTSILKIMFLASERILVMQENKISIWAIDTESDLLVNLKTVSSEPQTFIEDCSIFNDKNILLICSEGGIRNIVKLNLSEYAQNGTSSLKNEEPILLNGYPKNLVFDKFEQFNNEVICVFAKDPSSPDTTMLFFESVAGPCDLNEIQYLAGIERLRSNCSSQSDMAESKPTINTTEKCCWVLSDQKCDREIIGAQISVKKKGNGSNELSLLIYRHSNLNQCLVKSSVCSQQVSLPTECNSPSINNIWGPEAFSKLDIQFIAGSGKYISSNHTKNIEDQDKSVIYRHNLIITAESRIYLCELLLLWKDDSKFNMNWKANCNLLFCHDAHKSAIIHVLPYSLKLPHLFVSVESNNKLHAWHWQNDESKKESEEV